MEQTPKYRTIFISDVHLGSKYSNAEIATKFLKENTCESLILVGDIIDGWALRRKWFFPQSHVNVIRRVLTDAKRGKSVKYIIGNHDEIFRKWLDIDTNIGNISFADEYEHIDVNGKSWLVVHGDLFDTIMQFSVLTHVGDYIYGLLNMSNSILNKFRNKFGFGYWSLSQWAKHKTKSALNFIYKFEDHLIQYAKNKKYDGVICGHIHFPNIKKTDIMYANTGDFCETCSAIVERWDGKFELLIWKNESFITKTIFDHEQVEHIYF